jgi:hypothetical protein
MLLKIFNKILHYLLTIIIIGYIVFEELVWERFAQPIFRYISSLKILQKLSAYLQTVNSKLILILFVGLFIIVEAQGLYAASLFVQGKVIHGVLVYAGKIPISAFTFWLFHAVKDKLMEFIWFERAYIYVILLIEKITHSEIYLSIKEKTLPIKQYIRDKVVSGKGTFKTKVLKMYARLRVLLNKDL